MKPFCHILCLGMHSNMMLCFMEQALQDPPLCSSSSTLYDVYGVPRYPTVTHKYSRYSHPNNHFPLCHPLYGFFLLPGHLGGSIEQCS